MAVCDSVKSDCTPRDDPGVSSQTAFIKMDCRALLQRVTIGLARACNMMLRMLQRYVQVLSMLAACVLPSLPSVAQGKCSKPQAVTDRKFVPGQVWSYETRPGEESSRVTILRIEKIARLGTVIHIRIDGVHFSNCTGGPRPDLIQHSPFTRAALEASVRTKVGVVTTLPDYAAGYQAWLNYCGGVYTIPVERVVATDDATFNAGFGCR